MTLWPACIIWTIDSYVLSTIPGPMRLHPDTDNDACRAAQGLRV